MQQLLCRWAAALGRCELEHTRRSCEVARGGAQLALRTWPPRCCGGEQVSATGCPMLSTPWASEAWKDLLTTCN